MGWSISCVSIGISGSTATKSNSTVCGVLSTGAQCVHATGCTRRGPNWHRKVPAQSFRAGANLSICPRHGESQGTAGRNSRLKRVDFELATWSCSMSTLIHVSCRGRPTEIARNTNLLSKKFLQISLFLSRFPCLYLSDAMNAVANAAALSLPISLCKPSKINARKVL